MHRSTRTIALVVPAAVGAAVALATTSRAPHVSPSIAILAAAALAACAAFFVPERLAKPAHAAAAALAGAASGHVLFSAGMPRVHDLHHLWGIWAYGRCLHEGVFYPTWIPWLGAGMPLFQFYGPLNFLLAVPGILGGLSPVAAWKLELLQAHVLAALSMLVAARWSGAGRRGALLAAIAFSFAPWRLAVFDYRGALAEANALVLLPLLFAGSFAILREPRLRTLVGTGLVAAALVLTHLLSAFTFAVAGLAIFPFLGPRRLLHAATPFLAAALVTAAWWIPALAEARYTCLAQRTASSEYLRYAEHGVRPASLLERREWDELRWSLTVSDRRAGVTDDAMPFYFGAVLLCAALAAAATRRDRLTLALAAGTVLCLLLSTAPFGRMLGSLPGFAQLQFPWRFLSPATVLACLAVGRAAESWERAALPSAVALLLLWDGAPYTGAADRIPPYRGVTHWYARTPGWRHWDVSMLPVPLDWSREKGVVRVVDLQLPPAAYDVALDSVFPNYPEWLTPAIRDAYWGVGDPQKLAGAGVRYAFVDQFAEPFRVQGRPYASVAGGAAELVERRPGRIRVRARVPERGARLVVLEQAFPGWSVRVGGGPYAIPASSGGFLAVDLAAGEADVAFDYRWSTLPRRAGLGVSLVAGLAVLAVLLRKRVRE